MTGAKSRSADALAMVNSGAAAIDIGSTMHMAAVNPNTDDNPVRAFGTFTGDLHDMARWFKACGVTSVAMESTGVYWIPAYEVLEEHGFHVILVNARYAKNVPGRKTDVSDAAWLQRLHSYGLLRASFGRQTALLENAALIEPRGSSSAPGSHHYRAEASRDDLPRDADQHPWLSFMAHAAHQPACAHGHEGAGSYPGAVQPRPWQRSLPRT